MAAVSAFIGKLCKTITFLSSIKNVQEPTLSYKEAFVNPLSWSCAILNDLINQQRTNYANPSTVDKKNEKAY